MLSKFRINRSNFRNDKVKIDIHYDSLNTGLCDMYTDGVIDNEQYLMACECGNIEEIREGMTINAELLLGLDYSDTVFSDYNSSYTFFRDYQVSSVNQSEQTFSFIVDRLMNLPIINISSVKFEEPNENDELIEKNYLYVTFESEHYFDVNDNNLGEINLFFKYNGTEEYKTYPSSEDGRFQFEFITPTVLRHEITDEDFEKEDFKEFYAAIFKTEEFIETSLNTREVEVYRENFFFNPDKTSFELFYNHSLVNIEIPLQQSFDTNMYQSEILQEKYVNEEKRKAINGIVDMEKDVYYPVVEKRTKNGEETKKVYEDVYEIKFNLHFRKHNGENWLADKDSFWNGVYKKDEKWTLMNSSDSKNNAYFSHSEKSQQSDLLYALRFTNDDVKYQKNKLKKSFLRLSFYDSDDQTSQNLLCYSTIFLNGGKLYSKFVKYYEVDDNFKCLFSLCDTINAKDNEEVESVLGKNGIRVNREPYKNTDASMELGDIEDYRLSSQFSVQDKNASKSSSEGFYLYLWKDNDNGVIPEDIYMKIEFNHAGYGRTIPFMMPYFDPDRDNGKVGIKTFEQIVDDWNGENAGYGIRRYLKYSYIKMQHKYDSVTKKHIYYLNPDIYGNMTDVNYDAKTHTLMLNLYEAKIV